MAIAAPAVKKPSKDATQPKAARRPAVGARRLNPRSQRGLGVRAGDYAADVPYGVVVWLHAPGGFDWKELLARWKPLCDRYDLILVAPKSADPARWMPGEAALVDRLMEIASNYMWIRPGLSFTATKAGGSLAFLAAFRNRDMIRAVAAVEAARRRAAGERPAPPVGGLLATADKSPARPDDRAAVAAMRKLKIPVTVKNLGDVAALSRRRGIGRTRPLDRHAGPDLRGEGRVERGNQ